MSQLWGDCHVHSSYSDGLMSVPEQAPYFEAYGCDFRIQTDHLMVKVPEGSEAGTWLHASSWERYVEDCRLGTTVRHLCVPGVELGWEVGENGAPQKDGLTPSCTRLRVSRSRPNLFMPA